MQSNIYDERFFADPLLNRHDEKIQEMDLPEWMHDVDCPFCQKEVPARAIRNIQLCLNARNFGEIALEVFCDHCKKMDTLYFRTKMDSIADFVACLKGSYKMPVNYVLEEDMYRQNYNNMLEIMKDEAQQGEQNDSV